MSKHDTERIAAIQDQLETQRQRMFGSNQGDQGDDGLPIPSSADSKDVIAAKIRPSGFPRSVTMRLVLRNPDLMIWVVCALARRIGFAPRTNTRLAEQAFARFSDTLCDLVNAAANRTNRRKDTYGSKSRNESQGPSDICERADISMDSSSTTNRRDG